MSGTLQPFRAFAPPDGQTRRQAGQIPIAAMRWLCASVSLAKSREMPV
jgi:hypothetical protein